MTSDTFAGQLATLDSASLVALFRARPDVLLEPVPRSFSELAQRLEGLDSLAAATWALNRDALQVGQAAAALAESATAPALAGLLGASEDAVRAHVRDLCARGLAWVGAGGRVRLPQKLHDHWSEEITAYSGVRPVTKIAGTVLADDLRFAVAALGGSVEGLRKPELIARLAELMSDFRRIAAVVAALPEPARDRLDVIRHRRGGYYSYTGSGRGRLAQGSADPVDMLLAAGLLLRPHRQPELPREVAVAAWVAEQDLALTGPPELPRPDVDGATVASAARAAAQDAVRAVTALLDEAAAAPITALKKGGVGGRERTRLAGALSIPAAELPLWIDLAYYAGLLAPAGAGYAPTPDYQRWRSDGLSRQWAALAVVWLSLEHSPTHRELEVDKELPPPLPLGSAAGLVRRTLLHAVGAGESGGSGRSVRGAGEEIDWFCPFHGYKKPQLRAKVAAAVREAELLGLVAADVLSDLGEHLLSVVSSAGEGSNPASSTPVAPAAIEHLVDELARRCAALLPETSSSLVLQSDLTAVASGRPSAELAQLLRDAAVAESRGAAGTWRFTPASVRAALDAGWSADDLLGRLREMSARPVPQPLEYLVADVARRHGHVRVRGLRSCVISDESSTAEILHTRSLAKLHLSRLAPTALASPLELGEVLAELRKAGFYPVAEDAAGTVIVPERREHRAAPAASPRPAAASSGRRPAGAGGPTPRRRLAPDDLARRLRADPDGDAARDSAVAEELAELNRHLDDAELALLADAVEHGRDVVIGYRDAGGTRTVRRIQPKAVYGRWLDSWCHLRDAQRDFAVANIESVSPAG
jgi:hypothetical protein